MSVKIFHACPTKSLVIRMPYKMALKKIQYLHKATGHGQETIPALGHQEQLTRLYVCLSS